MSRWDLIGADPIASAVVAAVAAAALIAAARLAWRAVTDARDGGKIVRFLARSQERFRTTHAIASNVRLSEGRVEALCFKHPRIRRNERELQSWTLVD